jgi:hypothetical protein
MVDPTVVCTKIIVLTHEYAHRLHSTWIVLKWSIGLLLVQRLSFWGMNVFTDHMTVELCVYGHPTVVCTKITGSTHESFHRWHDGGIVFEWSIQLFFVQRISFWRMNLLTDHMTLELCLNSPSNCCLYKDYPFDAWMFWRFTWQWNCVWMVHPTVVCRKIIVLTHEYANTSHDTGIVFEWYIQLLFVQRLSLWRTNMLTDHVAMESC